MGWAKYVVRRLLIAIPQMLLISVVTFTLVRMLPGDPARQQLGPFATEEGVQQLRAEMHLDAPLPEQYVAYLGRLFSGDMGRSWVNQTQVAEDIAARLPVTLELIAVGLVVIIMVLLPVGVVTASPGGGIVRRVIKRVTFVYGLLAGALPDFWLGLMLLFVFFSMLGLLPGPEGSLPIGMESPPSVTGFITIDSLLAGRPDTFAEAVSHLVLPVITLALVYGGATLKTTRLSVARALRSDYITYLEGLGVPQRQLFILALRNAAPPIIVVTGIAIGFLLGGAVLIETVFNLNGIGRYAVQAVVSNDYAPIQAFVLVAALFTMLVYLGVDLIYFKIDPRVRGTRT